jgi:hypothetical protein
MRECPVTSARPIERRASATSTSPEVLNVARARVVSWLRAASLTFPALLCQWYYERAFLPDTVAGPRRHFTGFRGSRSRIDCSEAYRRRSARASANIIVAPISAVSAIM